MFGGRGKVGRVLFFCMQCLMFCALKLHSRGRHTFALDSHNFIVMQARLPCEPEELPGAI